MTLCVCLRVCWGETVKGSRGDTQAGCLASARRSIATVGSTTLAPCGPCMLCSSKKWRHTCLCSTAHDPPTSPGPLALGMRHILVAPTRPTRLHTALYHPGLADSTFQSPAAGGRCRLWLSGARQYCRLPATGRRDAIVLYGFTLDSHMRLATSCIKSTCH